MKIPALLSLLILLASSVSAAPWTSGGPDGGVTWKDLSDGLPVHSAMALAIDRGGNVLHAGVHQSGVWELRVRGRQRVVRRP